MFTLIVLTKDRPYFVMRFLGYYKATKFHGKICIADSSGSEYKSRNKHIIDGFNDSLDITYLDLDTENTLHGLNLLMRHVNTKYLVISRDTDFLVTRTINVGVDFLECHPDYSIVQGQSLGFDLHSFGAFGDFQSTVLLSQTLLDDTTSLNRLMGLLDGYSGLLNGVLRSDCLREINSQAAELHEGFLQSDFIPACLLVIQGKVKRLDSLLLVRQILRGSLIQGGWCDYEREELSDLGFSNFFDVLSNIIDNESDTLENAKRGDISEALYSFVANLMNTPSSGVPTVLYKEAGVFRRIGRKMAMIMPAVGWMWRRTQPIRQGDMYKTSIQGLLSTRYPYNVDFMPIYGIVTQPRLSAVNLINENL